MTRRGKELSLSTTVKRPDVGGEITDWDVIVYFKVVSYSPGCPEVRYLRNGDPGYPAEPAEYEFEFVGAEFDGAPARELGLLTDVEIEGLKKWFEENHDRACEEADEQADDGLDPDEAYERAQEDRRLERMFEGGSEL